MIPETEQQLATMIFLMEINEWGTEMSEKAVTKLAHECFSAAETFFKVEVQRYPAEQPKGHFQGERWNRLEERATELATRSLRKTTKTSKIKLTKTPDPTPPANESAI